MSVLIIWSLIFNVKCYEVADAGEGVGFFSIRENFLGGWGKFFVIGERDEEMAGRIFD